jgi:hypothetical protein
MEPEHPSWWHLEIFPNLFNKNVYLGLILQTLLCTVKTSKHSFDTSQVQQALKIHSIYVTHISYILEHTHSWTEKRAKSYGNQWWSSF